MFVAKNVNIRISIAWSATKRSIGIKFSIHVLATRTSKNMNTMIRSVKVDLANFT
jgi:hypothetical protein